MTTGEKVIKTKVGLLELGKQTRQRVQGVSGDVLPPVSFYRLKELSTGGGSGACGNLAQQTELKKSY